MKDKNLFLTMAMLIWAIVSFAQAPDTLWTKTYGGTGDEGGAQRVSVQQTTDGGFIIAGMQGGALNSNVYLVKTNANGDTLWTKTYGGSYGDAGNSVRQTTDGGYIVAGFFMYSDYLTDVYLIKTDANGNATWSKTYGKSTLGEMGMEGQQTSDGGYIVVGAIQESSGSAYYNVYLIKTNVNGDTLWTKKYGTASWNDIGYSIQQTTDGGYIMVGQNGAPNVYLIRTNATGTAVWTRTYGGSGIDIGRCVRQTSDKGYIIAGRTASFGDGDQVYLIKTDSLGDTLWTKTYGGPGSDRGESVQQTADGGYIIGAYTSSFGAGLDDFYLIKTNSSGDTLWTRTYGGTNTDRGYSVQETANGIYIFAGWTQSFGAGGKDFYLIRLQVNGAPVFPYITKVEKLSNNLKLSWNKVTKDTLGNNERMKSYFIYRSTSPDFIPGSADSIGYVNQPETTFTNAGIVNLAEDYYYLVKAVDSTNNKSKPSNMGYKFRQFLNENPDTETEQGLSGKIKGYPGDIVRKYEYEFNSCCQLQD